MHRYPALMSALWLLGLLLLLESVLAVDGNNVTNGDLIPMPPPATLEEPFNPLQSCGDPNTATPDLWAQCIISHVVGPPIVLPDPFANGTDTDVIAIYNQFIRDLLSSAEVLKTFGNNGGSPAAAEAAQFLESVQSVVAAVKYQLDSAAANNDCGRLLPQVEPTNAKGVRIVDPTLCQKIRNGDPIPSPTFNGDPLTVVAPLGDDNIFRDFVASPFLPLPPFGAPDSRAPKEAQASRSIPPGGAFLAVKEVFGLKLRLWYTNIPIWVEPWYPRRRIVGFRKIWQLRWVPCEYIKSIISNSDNYQVQPPTFNAVEYCDSRLLSYWRWFSPAKPFCCA